MKIGEAKFVIFTTHLGTVDDDAVILRLAEDEFLLSCGGSKLPEQTLTYLSTVMNEFPNANVSFPNLVSFNIKGPKRIESILHLISDLDREKVLLLKPFQFTQVNLINGEFAWIVKSIIGIEMWGNVDTLCWAWKKILKHPEIFTPCGWDILHTYRMECEEILLSVYPFDIHDATTLWEIHCGWMTKEKECVYIGKRSLMNANHKKIFELKKIRAACKLSLAAKVGSILIDENGDFSGYVTSSAFSIKSERALAFAHVLIDKNDGREFYIKASNDCWHLE